MKRPRWLIGALVACVYAPVLRSQEKPFRITVLAYQWTTTHNTVTFSWPGYANTSCYGNTCSTTYTPPRDQNISVQQPVVLILAETESSRMVLTCTRIVRWSQCHALNPGTFLARNDHGPFEVQAFENGKEKWIRFDIVQQTAISRQQPSVGSPAASPIAELRRGLSPEEVQKILGTPVSSSANGQVTTMLYNAASGSGSVEVDYYNGVAVDIRQQQAAPSATIHKGMSLTELEEMAGKPFETNTNGPVTTNKYRWQDGVLEADFVNDVLVGYRIASN